MFTEGRKAYILFTSIKEGVGGYESELQNDQQQKNNNVNNTNSNSSNNNSNLKSSQPNEQNSDPTNKKATVDEATRTRARGELWMRQSLSRGGELEVCYGVLERGKLDIYRSESVSLFVCLSFDVHSLVTLLQEYKKLSEPITKHPILLWKYRLELDPRLVKSLS